jgi:UDP-N-acetylglucosamine 2-epimerase (non-hydrolysing)
VFGVSPDNDLDLMQVNQTPSQVAARVLLAVDPLLEKLQPDWVLVQGDTTTVMATSIAAHHRRVKVAHVEAGLRTYDRANPFPEEMNRVVTDHISDYHFAPTSTSRQNLLREGISPESIFITGNTVIDALQWGIEQPTPPEVIKLLHGFGISRKEGDGDAYLKSAETQAPSRRLILITAHRRENFGEPIRGICQALRQIAHRGDVHIIYPVHRNPNIWDPVHHILGAVPGITLIPPVDYLTLIHLMKHSTIILTDSGGLQEEAPSLGVPVLVLRETTERPEAVEYGAACLVGTDPDRIRSEAEKLLDDPAAYACMANAINPYGDGLASRRIVDVFLTGGCQEFTPSQRIN